VTTLGVVIVGAGGIAATHLDVVLANPGFRLTGIVSRSGTGPAALAETAASRQGGPPWITASTEEALRRGDTELVVICTESSDHAGTAISAVEAGRHVLVEKPVATRLADARRLAEAARSASVRHPGQVVSVVSQRRFAPATTELLAAVAEGRLGRITSAAVLMPWWRGAEYYATRPWRGTWAGDGGGSLMNQGIHFVDLMTAALGRPAEVTALTGTPGHEGLETEDTAGVVIRFADGPIATMLTTTAAHPGEAASLHLHGTEGTALLVDDRLSFSGASAHEAAPAPTPQRIDDAARSAAPAGGRVALARQYADVLGAVRDRRPPRVGLEEAVAALALVKAAYSADATRRVVAFDEVLAGALDHRDPAGV
jgi:predicted dehydrogenase